MSNPFSNNDATMQQETEDGFVIGNDSFGNNNDFNQESTALNTNESVQFNQTKFEIPQAQQQTLHQQQPTTFDFNKVTEQPPQQQDYNFNEGFVDNNTIQETETHQQQGDEEQQEEQPRHWYHFYKASFYRPYFNVDIFDILLRMFHGTIPFFGNFFDKVSPTADLYGPIWIIGTTIFLVFFAGSLSSEFANETFQFSRLSLESLTLFGYFVLVPLALYFICRFIFKCKLTLVEYYCLYGYSFTCFIVLIPLCVLPCWIVQLVCIIIGIVISTGVIIKSLFPHLVLSSNIYITIGVAVVLLILQLALGAVLAYSVWTESCFA